MEMTFIKYKGGKVLEIKRHSTSMISNEIHTITIRTLDFAVLLIVFIVYCCGGEIKFSLTYQ